METWVQPVPEKIEMLVETQIEILDGQSSHLFSNEPFEKRPGKTIEDFGCILMTISSLNFLGLGSITCVMQTCMTYIYTPIHNIAGAFGAPAAPAAGGFGAFGAKPTGAAFGAAAAPAFGAAPAPAFGAAPAATGAAFGAR